MINLIYFINVCPIIDFFGFSKRLTFIIIHNTTYVLFLNKLILRLVSTFYCSITVRHSEILTFPKI